MQCSWPRLLHLELELEPGAAGVVRSWEPHPRLPRVSLRMLLARFLDLTTPPTPQLLQWLATEAKDPEEQRALTLLATESAAYEDWRHWRFPHLLEVTYILFILYFFFWSLLMSIECCTGCFRVYRTVEWVAYRPAWARGARGERREAPRSLP